MLHIDDQQHICDEYFQFVILHVKDIKNIAALHSEFNEFS